MYFIIWAAGRIQGKRGVITGMDDGGMTILLKDNGNDLYVKTDDIYYIESQHNKLVFSMDGRKIINKGTIKDMLQSLSNNEQHQFCHIHRSYIVNLAHIKERDENDLLMPDGQRIPVSRHRLKYFKEQYGKYLEGLS